jgi:hypothetical protein
MYALLIMTERRDSKAGLNYPAIYIVIVLLAEGRV